MEFFPFLLILLPWCMLGVAAAAPIDSKIVLTMDKTANLNPSNKMHFAKSIFSYHLLTDAFDIPAVSDIVAHANYSKLISTYQRSMVKIPPIFSNDVTAINLFEDKAAWKKWMHSIGLGSYVPATYNNTASPDSFEYPMILKTNVHFGRGVFIVTSSSHLQELVANLTHTGASYTLEEALTGMGLSEASSYGAVLQGKLLSMRCLKRSFTPETSQRSVGRSFNSQHTPTSTPYATIKPNSSLYIMGFAAKPSQQHLLPCSQELIAVTRSMFQHTNYTGPFCSNIKLDRHLRPKMMEINARFCGSMAANEALFIATFVPLAFAALAGTARREVLLNIANKDAFRRILDTEAAVLQSGGGIFQNTELTVANFSANLALDPITAKAYLPNVKISP